MSTTTDTPTYKSINSSILIDEVRKRPVLYDPKINNVVLKKTSWVDVAKAVFKHWEEYSTVEREGLIKEIQTKWKSLRDNFTRVLRKEKDDESLSDGSVNKKKRYVNYEALMFLAPYVHRRTLNNVVFVEENRDSNDSSYAAMEDTNPLPPLQFFEIQPNTSYQVSPKAQNDEDPVPTISPNNKSLVSILEQLVAVQKEEKTDDPMGNKKFLLSLLPFMRKLPDDVNLEVRLQIMSVLQCYSVK